MSSGTGVSSHGGAPEQDVLLGPHAVVRLEAAPGGVVRARADDRLRARAARAVELALHEDVEPLPRDLGRHPEDGDHGVVGHVRRPEWGRVERTEPGHAGCAILAKAGPGRNRWQARRACQGARRRGHECA